MRGLQTHDVFVAMRVVNALGIKDEFKKMAEAIAEGRQELNEKEIGIDLILTVIGNAGDENAERKIYDALAGPLEMDPSELAVMEPMELIESIKKLSAYVDAEAWKSFFSSVASMMR